MARWLLDRPVKPGDDSMGSVNLAMWRATVLTIFPEMFPGPFGASLAGRRERQGLWSLDAVDIRNSATDSIAWSTTRRPAAVPAW